MQVNENQYMKNETENNNISDILNVPIINTTINNDIKVDENFNMLQDENVSVKNKNDKMKVTDVLMIIWTTGSLGMILYATISYLKLKRTVMFAVKVDDNYYETDMISTPCVVGIIKPKIYLTLNLSDKEKTYILTHENVHIKRKDYFSKVIAYLILSIHWVNPVCWILFKMFVNDMEMLCDEESIKKLGKENKVGYMESLVNLSSKNMKKILPCPIAFSENNTEKRVKNMIKYKNSGIIISVIALIICIIIAAICLTDKQEKLKNEDNVISGVQNQLENNLSDDLKAAQLNLILNNKNLWYKDTEVDKYSYAVTDLDKNGRLEIISSICQGTGIYTYTDIYEVNEKMDGLNLCESNLNEYDSQADIIKNQFIVFYDSANKRIHYIFDDLTKNGAAEYYENKRDFCLSDGKINEKYLVYKTTIYENGTPKVTYTDLNNNVITEEEYNNFINKYFNKFDKMLVNIAWMTNYPEISLENLKYSFDNFAFYKLEDLSNDTERREKYISILKDVYNNYVLPDGTKLSEVEFVPDYDMSQNKFAIHDVDSDGRNELIIALTNSPMAAMRTIIYDYDSATDTLKEQLTEFPAINFYNNGIIEVMWSHNQGSAGDSLWPYTMYSYNKESDSYNVVAQIDAWDKSFNEESYIADTFPEEIDKDGDGIVYYIMYEGKYEYNTPVDFEEYDKWRSSYITDETTKIIFPYMNMTIENINNI